jgi:phosphohistidine phosphatase
VKRLLILRHAKSSWADSSQDDWERPLNERGARDAPLVGHWLRQQQFVPELIITSDAVRARSTAEAAAAAAGYAGTIITHPELYLATPQQAIDVVREDGGEAGTVMIVGHNPGLEDLVWALTGEHHAMPTAALAVVDLPIARWSELDHSAAGSITDTWQPRE